MTKESIVRKTGVIILLEGLIFLAIAGLLLYSILHNYIISQDETVETGERIVRCFVMAFMVLGFGSFIIVGILASVFHFVIGILVLKDTENIDKVVGKRVIIKISSIIMFVAGGIFLIFAFVAIISGDINLFFVLSLALGVISITFGVISFKNINQLIKMHKKEALNENTASA